MIFDVIRTRTSFHYITGSLDCYLVYSNSSLTLATIGCRTTPHRQISLTRKWYMSGAREPSDTLLLSLYCAASARSVLRSLFLPISKFAATDTSKNSFVMTRYVRKWWGVGYEVEGVNTTHRWRASDAHVIYKTLLTRKWYMSGAREPSDTLLLSLYCAASARSVLRSLFLPISKFAATDTSKNSFVMTRYVRKWWGVGYEVEGVNTTHRWRVSDAPVIYKIS